MRNCYLVKDSVALRKILLRTAGAFQKALKVMAPGKKALTECPELSQAHDCLALIKTGHIKIEWLEGFDERCLVLTIREEG